MSLTRRRLIKRAGVSLLAGAGLLAMGLPVRASACRRVSGAGSHLLGPFQSPIDPSKPVFLVTDLGFDETMAFCKVSTNYDAMLFPTAKLGVVELGAHEFFMDMESTHIDSLDVQMSSDGPVAIYSGRLASETRIGSGANAKTYSEQAAFGCNALDLGPTASVQILKDNFSMSVHFDPAGNQAAIFGEHATFAGHLTTGHISIVP